MGIFNFLNRRKETKAWDLIRDTAEVYPQSSISILLIEDENQKMETGWIDMAYTTYPYKRFCPYNLQFSVETPDNDDKNSLELDLGAMEDCFIDELRKGCVAHAVSRLTTEFGFIMDLYVDDTAFASEKLSQMYADPNKPFEFGCGFKHDPNWKEFKRIAASAM